MKYSSILTIFLLHNTQWIDAMMPTNNWNTTASPATIMCYNGIHDNKLALVKKALRKGADVNFTNKEGKSLLHIACDCKHKSIIKEILKEESVDITMHEHSEMMTPLHLACENNLPSIVQLILNKNPQTVNQYTREGNTPLHVACTNLHKKCVQNILAIGNQNINSQNFYGETPLHAVARIPQIGKFKKQLKIFKLLIEHGADIRITDTMESTPLLYLFNILHHHLCKSGHFIKKNHDFLQQHILQTDRAGNNQFHLCATLKLVDNIHFQDYFAFLQSYGLNIQTRNNNGQRAVDIAYAAFQVYHQEYMKDEWLNINIFFEQEKNFFHQEILLHNFLQFTVPLIQAALFKAIVSLKSNENILLPNELITYILQYYYLINIETMLTHKIARSYFYYTAAGTHELRCRLITDPEPNLLWSK